MMKTAVLVTIMIVPWGARAAGQDDTGWNNPSAIRPSRARVDIKNQIEISADVPGKITYLNPGSRGGVVEKGQVVVELDSRLVRAQLAEAQAKADSEVLIDYAAKSLDVTRQKLKTKLEANERAKTPVFSDDEIIQLRLEVTKGEAELAKSREDQHIARLAAATKMAELEQYTVKAEIGGIVTDNHKKAVGSAVRQGDPIITVVDLEEVLVVLTVNPEHEERINIGDKVLVRKAVRESGRSILRNASALDSIVTPTSLPQAENRASESVETFIGAITYIGASNTDEKNSLEVEAVVKNELAGPQKYKLREGLVVEARILSP